MDTWTRTDRPTCTRRDVMRVTLSAAAGMALTGCPRPATAAAASGAKAVRIGISARAAPLAGDDREALEMASRLVRDAGFEPFVVGPLARSRAFDPGTAVFGTGLTARELRGRLGIGATQP